MHSACRLDELVAAVDEKTGLVKDPTLPYLGLEHIGQRGAGLTGKAESAASISTNSIFKTNDVLFGKLRPNLRKCALAPFDGYCSTDVLVLRPLAEVQPRFAARVFQTESVGAEAERTAAGTKMPRTSWKELRALEVFCPDFQSQRNIAEILDTLDTTIRQTEAIIEKLKQVKQGLLHDLLTRGIDANGELRPPQSQAPHLYKDSQLGWIPQEWEVRQLQELLSADDPAMRSGPFGSALLKHELVETGLPLLGIDNVHVEQFNTDFTRFVTEKKFNELARYAVRPLDLMITIMGTVGRCCVVPEGIGQALSSKHTWTITLDRAKYSPLLAMLQINYCEWVLSQFAKDEQGGIMSAIRSETLRTVILPTPPIEEQLELQPRMQAISSRIDAESSAVQKFRLAKSGLMDDLLTGRVRVTPLLDRSTSA
jgi:type I restriction enzyme, S subunit